MRVDAFWGLRYDRLVNTDSDCRTPGQLLKKLLDERGWSQRILAVILAVDVTIIHKMVSDKRRIDAQSALLLGEAFGVEPDRFLDLQKSYELAMARVISQPDPRRATRAYLFGDLPVSEMIKRGWLKANDVRDVPNVETALTNFFEASSIDDIEVLPHAAKKTNVAETATPAQLAWIYRVRGIAREMMVGPYSPAAVQEAVTKLKALTAAPEEARKVPRILTEAGIRFVLVESLASAKIDGVCFWLNDQSPIIGMTLRFDRIDNFWFVLRHELEHVIRLDGLDSGAVILDAELEGDRAGTGNGVAEEERAANGAAAEFCVPKKKLDSFIARKSPIFAERDIIGFASTLKVHPGIVAGRLQHATGRYDLFRNHLVKIRSHIAPSAIVDGWGDVSPFGI